MRITNQVGVYLSMVAKIEFQPRKKVLIFVSKWCLLRDTQLQELFGLATPPKTSS